MASVEFWKGVLCAAKKKGGRKRAVSPQCEVRLKMATAEPQEILCYAMRVSDLGSLFVFFEGFG